MQKSQIDGVLVTGAGSGVGLEIVRSLLADSAVTVWAVARNGANRLAEELSRYPQRVKVIDCDLADPSAIVLIREAVGSNRLIGLVHNAAVLGKTEFGEYQKSNLLNLFDLNVITPLLLTQALAHCLEGENPGHVVHIGSMGGYQDSAKFPGLAGYSSSKAALASLGQCLAEEFKDRGIRSNSLALGATDTEMLRAAFPSFRASTSASEMGSFIAWFTLHGHNLFNGKVLPVSQSTP